MGGAEVMGEGADRTIGAETVKSVSAWLTVTVQRTAERLGRDWAQHVRGPSQALPHCMCVAHRWSVRPAERPRIRTARLGLPVGSRSGLPFRGSVGALG